MNKVTTVNLNGNAYQLEETAYEILHAYLEDAARRLEKNPDKDEIVSDIERAIAEKFRATLGPHKTVVVTREVEAIIAEMGPVEDSSEPSEQTNDDRSSTSRPGESGTSSAPPSGGATAEPTGPARRLYRIPDGAMIAGVCNGIAAYFGIDPISVRLGFIVFSVLIGLIALFVHWFILIPIIAYSLLAAFLPAANTPDERAAARGDPSTAQEFIRRAKQGYYEGMKKFHDHASRKEWKREVKHTMRGWRRAYRDEMRDHARGSDQNWHHDWTTNPAAAWAPALALPVLGVVEAMFAVVALIAVVQLLTMGAVFGLALPAGVPLWIGIVAVIFAIHTLTWPIKAMRHSCYAVITGRTRHSPVYVGFWDSLVWLAAMVAMIWLADHYIPQVHEFIVKIPAALEKFGDSVKQWWGNR